MSDDNSILIGDGGDFVATVAYNIKARKPLSWLDPGVFGTLGVGAGFAMAAKLVHPESEVWLFWGDGASGFSLMEFDTLRRHKIPGTTESPWSKDLYLTGFDSYCSYWE